MRINGPGSKRRVAAAAGIAAVVLAGASFAWACTAGIETAQVSTGNTWAENTTATAGDTVEVKGDGWQPAGTVSIYLASDAGRIPLVERVPIQNFRTGIVGKGIVQGGTIRAQFTVPNVAPGDYSMEIWHNEKDGVGELSKVASPMITVGPPRAVANNPAPTGNPGPTANPIPANNGATTDVVVTDPVTGEAPAGSTATAPAPAAAADPGQTPDAVATPASGDTGFVAGPLAPTVTAEDWTGSPSPATERPAQRRLGDTPSESTNGGLLVGAGLLAVGSVALFGGFAVAVARRRKVGALATPGF